MATILTGGNRHDITQLVPLIDAVPPVRGKPGAPRRRPESIYGDRAYSSEPHRREMRRRRIRPFLTLKAGEHGSGLGTKRWVVERTISWLHQFRRLRVRFERRAHIHEAFLALGCAVICLRALGGPL